MSVLIRNRDLLRLCKGAAFAVTAGLIAGAAMQPDLDANNVEGPQILLAGGGDRAKPAAYDPGTAAYGAELPDYVVGTDYLQPAATEILPAYEEPAESIEIATIDASYEAPVIVYEAAEEAEADAARSWREPPRAPPIYPSQQGNTYYASDLPDPPTPPEEDDWPPAPA